MEGKLEITTEGLIDLHCFCLQQALIHPNQPWPERAEKIRNYLGHWIDSLGYPKQPSSSQTEASEPR